jgi:hypothetical protein
MRAWLRDGWYWVMENWEPFTIILVIVAVIIAALVLGFWHYPRVATFAVVTAAALVALLFLVAMAEEWRQARQRKRALRSRR